MCWKWELEVSHFQKTMFLEQQQYRLSSNDILCGPKKVQLDNVYTLFHIYIYMYTHVCIWLYTQRNSVFLG